MTRVVLIALGSPQAGDDVVAMSLAMDLTGVGVDVFFAGRPGIGLIDMLDSRYPILLLDVVKSGAPAGTIFELSFDEVIERAVASEQLSSHGFGPAEALRLAASLDRPPPRGRFLGIEGGSFELGTEPSAEVTAALPEFRRRARAAIAELQQMDPPCTNPA